MGDYRHGEALGNHPHSARSSMSDKNSVPKPKPPAAPRARVSKSTIETKHTTDDSRGNGSLTTTKAPPKPRVRKPAAPRARTGRSQPSGAPVLMVSPEAHPFAKTGGLAEVAGALPHALARLGYRVTLVLPR